MAKKGTATATLTLDYSLYERAAKAVMSITQAMGGAIEVATGVVIGTIAVDAIKRFASAIPEAVVNVTSLGEEMANMAHATGMAAGQFYTFQLAVKKGLSLNDASFIVGKNAEMLSRDADLFRDMSLRLYAIGERIKGFWIGMVEKVTPGLNLIFDRLSKFDFSEWGQALGNAFETAFEVLYGLVQNGKVFETISLTLQSGFATAMNYLSYGANVFVSILRNFFANLPELIANSFTAAGVKSAARIAQMFTIQNLVMGASKNNTKDANEEIFKNALSAGNNVKMVDYQGAAKLMEALRKNIEDARISFATTEKPAHFENRYAIQNFGVSSLQKLGLGGTVNGPSGLSITDYAARQLSELQQIKDNTKGIADIRPSTDDSNRDARAERRRFWESGGATVKVN